MVQFTNFTDAKSAMKDKGIAQRGHLLFAVQKSFMSPLVSLLAF